MCQTMETAYTKLRYSWHGRLTLGQEHVASPPLFWRPWLITAADSAIQRRELEQSPHSTLPGTDGAALEEKVLSGFNHPVRLFWPKSKSFDYLYSNGEMLLKNFPVQATINFYDESDSEDEEWEEETEEEKFEQVMDSKLGNPMACEQRTSPAEISSSAYHCLN